MKSRIIKRLVCALLAAVMMIMCSMPAFAWDMDMGYADLTFSNAPAGTKYIDILVPIFRARSYFDGTHDIKLTFIKKLRTKDSYKEETVEKTIGKDSEIAKYVDEDGFISLTAHTDLVKGLVSYGNFRSEKTFDKADYTYGYQICFSGSDYYWQQQYDKGNDNYKRWDVDDINKTFKEFKAAYIDEKGNVLGVTKEFEVKKNENCQHTFIADGDKLTLVINNHLEKFWWELIRKLIPFAISFIGLIVIFILFIKWIIQGVRASKE